MAEALVSRWSLEHSGDPRNRAVPVSLARVRNRVQEPHKKPNQLRMLFSVAAYVLFQVLQILARGTALALAQVGTLRERLLKIAVWVERSVRRLVLHFPQAFPWRDAWQQLAHALGAT